MANDVTLPGTGAVVETLDIGTGIQRQAITISPRDLSAADSIGSLTEAAPATDTASSGLNGRLQRVAQNITALISAMATNHADETQLHTDLSVAVVNAINAPTTIGSKTDAKNPATDATSISAMSVWKQISASIQSMAAAVLLTGGQTATRVNSAATTNATILKAAAGNLLEIDVFNTAAYPVYLKFYDKATAPVVGTDAPIWTIPIPTSEGYSRSFPRGKGFATGIAFAITKLQADSDATAVAAGDLTGSIDVA